MTCYNNNQYLTNVLYFRLDGRNDKNPSVERASYSASRLFLDEPCQPFISNIIKLQGVTLCPLSTIKLKVFFFTVLLPSHVLVDWFHAQVSRTQTVHLHWWSESSTEAIFPLNSPLASKCSVRRWRKIWAICPDSWSEKIISMNCIVWGAFFKSFIIYHYISFSPSFLCGLS